jgi:hypothetical protein
MATFRIRLETAHSVRATDADLSSTVEIVHGAGGTDVSVFQSDERGRAEFALEAPTRGQAAGAVHAVLVALTNATPLLAGGWVLVSITVT